ncbi:hypothetical protein D3C81_1676470 [compost metagenome]
MAHVELAALLQLLAHRTRSLAIGEVARQQQLLAIGSQQTEAETAVVFAEADKARGLGGLLLDLGSGLLDVAE